MNYHSAAFPGGDTKFSPGLFMNVLYHFGIQWIFSEPDRCSHDKRCLAQSFKIVGQTAWVLLFKKKRRYMVIFPKASISCILEFPLICYVYSVWALRSPVSLKLLRFSDQATLSARLFKVLYFVNIYNIPGHASYCEAVVTRLQVRNVPHLMQHIIHNPV